MWVRTGGRRSTWWRREVITDGDATRGTHLTDSRVADPERKGNCSVIGGYVYRGRKIKELYGWYVFGDYCSGRIWALRRQGGRVKVKLLLDTDLKISSFGEDRSGEIYVVDYAEGKVYLLSP